MLYYRDKDNSENESAKEDEQVYCTVRADEIPEEPGKSFLMRDFEEPEIEEDIKGKDEAKEKNSISRR